MENDNIASLRRVICMILILSATSVRQTVDNIMFILLQSWLNCYIILHKVCIPANFIPLNISSVPTKIRNWGRSASIVHLFEWFSFYAAKIMKENALGKNEEINLARLPTAWYCHWLRHRPCKRNSVSANNIVLYDKHSRVTAYVSC